MKHYEQILDKIAPTFYKTIQYDDYFSKFYDSITSYLRNINVPNTDYVYLLPIDMYFIINIRFLNSFAGKVISGKIKMMATKDMKPHIYDEVTLVEFVVNMVINNFSFENHSINAPYISSTKSYKDLFIALVGKDMYETLRANIR